MQNRRVSDDVPEVTLSLKFDHSLSRIATLGDPLNEAVHGALVQRLTEILETLGIPGTAVVRMSVTDGRSLRAGRPLEVVVNGRLCRYSDELLRWVRSYILGWALPPERSPDEILLWLRELSEDPSEKSSRNNEMLVEFLSFACIEILISQPEVLLGLPQVVAYSDSLPDLPGEVQPQPETWPPEPVWLLPILSKVLQLKISIADKQTVSRVLWTEKERSQEDIGEELILALRPGILEIQLPQEYLRQLTLSDPQNGLGMFSFLRDGMFAELGLHFPAFRFAVVDDLKPNSFAFRLNHLTTLPRIGLLPDQCLVNDTPERVHYINFDGKATSNPANGQIASIIDLSLKNQAEHAGLTTWTPLGYFILTLAAHLRQNSACFVNCQSVQERLDQLKPSFPALVDAVPSNLSTEQITRVLRALTAEEIPIRNLRAILERLLDYAYMITDSSRGFVLENRLTSYEQLNEDRLGKFASIVAFVRAGLKHEIANKYARGTNTLVVYLFDDKVEELFLDRFSLEEDQLGSRFLEESACDTILDALRAELAYLPPTALMPSILTLNGVRPFLREIIATEFPRMPVLCYQELPSDLNIQPVARISAN